MTAAAQRPSSLAGAVARAAQPPPGRVAPRRGHRRPARGSSPAWRPSWCRPRGRRRPASATASTSTCSPSTRSATRPPRASSAVFGGPEVTASASFTNYPMLVEGRTVPGLGVTPIRGESGPTILEGEPAAPRRRGGARGRHRRSPRSRRRRRRCRCRPATAYHGRATAAAAGPARRRAGDVRRDLAAGGGRGAARRRRARHPADVRTAARLRARTCPSGPSASLADGTDPTDLIDANPDGVEDELGVETRWFTDARPAELAAARRGLAGARRCRGGRPPAPRHRARAGRLVADPSERRRPVGAPGARVLPLASSPAPRRGSPSQPASPRWSSGSRSGSRSVDSPSAPSPDRSPWWTTPSSPPWLVVALALAVGASVGVAALVAGQVARHVSSAATLRDAEGRRA